MKVTVRLTLVACTLLLFMANIVFGQSTGAVGGSVLDPTSAAVPNAEITFTNAATNVATKVTSLADGKYLVSNLIPGTYEVSVDASGFKRTVRSGVAVHVSDNLTLNISLELGESRETVSVTETAPLLRTEDAQKGELVDNNFIKNMPALNRNPFGLLQLSGNVATTPGTTGQDNSIQINGGRTSSIDYYVDGGVVNSGQSNRLTNQQPSMDAVAEFKVVTSGISAEFGRISGGYVTLVTKSGSNNFHGSLYEYMYNDMFNANSWAQNVIGAKKAHFRQNNYGFTLGGPVRIPKVFDGRNRTFFFVDNEYLKNTGAGTISLAGMPNADERNGDFSKSLYEGRTYPIYDPYGPQAFFAGPGVGAGLYERLGLLGGDGKRVPPSLISPVAVAILKFIPMPNAPAKPNSSSQNNYQSTNSNSLYNFRFGVKLDHNLTDAQRVSFRWSTFDSNQARTPTIDTPLYTSQVTESNGGLNLNLSHTWTATPTIIVDSRASVTHSPGLTGAVHPADFNNSFLPSIYQKYLGTNNVQAITNSFMNGTPYAQSGSFSVTNSTNYNFASTVTKVMSKHTIKYGGETRRYYDNFLDAGGANTTNFMVNPVHRFQGDWGNGAIEGRILGMASFLMGINNRNNVSQPTTRAMNTNYFGLFIQDDIKLTPKLTMNIGIRYDNERPTTERNDNIFFWDPEHPSMYKVNPGYNYAAQLKAANLPADAPVPYWVASGQFKPGAVGVANSKEYPFRSPQTVSNLNFSPRLGFAYQLNSKTVIRVSGGKMYLPTTGNPNSYATSNGAIPLSDQAFAGWHASTDGGRNYISTWATPFPLPSMFQSPSRDLKIINDQSSTDPGANAVTRDLHMPREYNWAASVQRLLPGNNVVELGYAGNRGLGLLATDTISHYPAELLKPQYAGMMQGFLLSPNAGQTLETTITGTNQQLGLLQYDYPYYGRVQVSGINEGRSTYHALTLRLEHRFSSGLSFLGNYTHSQLLDDVGGPDGQGKGGVQSVDSFRAAWGLSAADRKDRLNLAFTYQLPFGTGQKWLGSPNGFAAKSLDAIVGGWTFAGNHSFTTGTPLSLPSVNNGNINNTIKVNQTWGSYVGSDHNLINPLYKGDEAALYSSITPLPRVCTPGTAQTGALNGLLDCNKVYPARSFVRGDLPINDDAYRNPSFKQLDLSLMKNFRLGEGKIFQFRAEARNAFNLRGFGNYNSSIGSPNYGLITSAGNDPRQIQLSARINF